MEKETNFLNEMAALLRKTWPEADTQALQSWFDLMESLISHSTVDSKPELEFMTQGFVEYQQLQLRLFQLSFNAWQDLLSKFESEEDWQQPLSNYSEKLRKEVEQFFQEKLLNNQHTAQLWQIYSQEMQKFNQLLNGMQNPWIELNNLYWNFMYKEMFGSLMRLSPPNSGSDLQSKLLQAFEAWAKLYPTSIDYQFVLAQVQIQSFEELIPDLILLASKGEKVKDWLQFQKLWSSTADKVFETTFCLEDNIKVRGRFLNAINNYKLSQQGLMEVWMKMMNMPIRSEVDEIHKTIYELRKEVKGLKKTLAKYEEAQVAHEI